MSSGFEFKEMPSSTCGRTWACSNGAVCYSPSLGIKDMAGSILPGTSGSTEDSQLCES